jgi:hypothetical protein
LGRGRGSDSLLQSIETHVDSAFRAEARPAGPSCGYDPLQRCTNCRCITTLALVIPIRASTTRESSFRAVAPFGLPSTDRFRDRSSEERWQRTASPAVTPTSGCNPTWPAGRSSLLCWLHSLRDPKIPQPEDQARRPRPATLMEFGAPTTLEPERVHSTPVCQSRVRSVHRVSHPLDGLLLARTPGLISCRKRPWGSPFREFPSLPGPVARRAEIALLALFLRTDR